MSASPYIMHFVRAFSIMRAGLLLSERFEITERLSSSEAFLKISGEGDVSPHIPLDLILILGRLREQQLEQQQ